MDDRIYLSDQLELVYPGVKRYYRPSNNLTLTFPCIIYSLKNVEAEYADNGPYTTGSRFEVVLVSNLPGEFDEKLMLQIHGAVQNTSYVENDLVHDVFTVLVNK